MKRVTITLDDELWHVLENRYGKKQYLNFSAIVRDLLRDALQRKNVREGAESNDQSKE